MVEDILSIEDLHLTFPAYSGDVEAVSGVSLHVGKGEIVGVVGESGSAKSVTAMAALRLLPKGVFTINRGGITLLGRDALSLSDNEMNELRGRDVAMIFQEPQTALNPTKTIGEQMRQVIKLHTNLNNSAANDLAVQLLTDMRINDAKEILNRYPFELSGGMRQRILIGLAFACSPTLLVADEPTTALDVTVQRQVLQLTHNKARQTGASVLFISHDLAVVSQFCDRIYVMYAGSVVERGPTKEILKTPQHPYTQALIKALPDSVQPGEPLNAIRGTVPDLANRPTGCNFEARCDYASEKCKSKPPLFDEGLRATACWQAQPRQAEGTA